MRVPAGAGPAAPAAPSGPVSLCANSSGTYTVTAAGATSYVWTLTGGLSGTSTTNSINVTAGATGGTISVAAVNSCGSSAASAPLTVTIAAAPANPGTITGAASVCAGSSQTYSVTAVTGATYTWTLPNGWTGTSTTNSINVTAGTTGGTISVTANNACNASSTPSTLAVSVNPLPAAPGAITGSAAVCAGATALTYSVPAAAGATFNWTLPTGWTITSTPVNANSITVTAGTAGGTISVTANNSCGNSAAVTQAVTVNSTPAQPGTISGPAAVCAASSQTYTVPAVTGVTYNWTLPTGWTITSSPANSNSITVITGTGGGTISVVGNNSCGNSTAQTLAVSISAPVTPSVTIAAAPGTTICSGVPVTFTATPVNGGTASYQWKRNNVNEGSNSATYTPAVLNNGDQISVVMTGSLPCVTAATATSNTLTMTVNSTPAQPAAISGSATPCIAGTAAYSVTAVTGATYTWTLPNGWTGTSTSNSISVVVGSGSGNVTVTATNSCGTSTPRSLAVSAITTPATPAPISGPATPCAGISSVYSVPGVNGVTYTWSAPSGWSGTSTGSSISYTAGTTAGTVNVTAGNACGTSAAQTFAVNPNPAPAQPGAISGPTAVCAGTSQTYTIANVPGANAYSWTLPNGWTGNSSGTSIMVTTGANGGTITVAASGPCGTSTPRSLAVTASSPATPSVSISANPGASICAGQSVTFTPTPSANALAPIYTWYRDGQPIAQGATFTTAAISSGQVFTVGMTAGSLCGASTTVTSGNAITMNVTPSVLPGININTVPPTTLCAGSMITFLTNIAEGGSAPQYQWYKNGNPIPGATAPTYLDAGLANGDTITVRLTSNAVCALPAVVSSNKVGLTIQPIVQPAVSVTALPGTTVFPGTQVVFTATYTNGGANPGLQWVKNGTPIPNATGPTYTTTNLQNGDLITVKLQSNAPCATQTVVTAAPLNISIIPTGVGTTQGTDGLQAQLFPNPNEGRFSIRVSGLPLGNEASVQLEVINALGQRVWNESRQPLKAEWQEDIQLADRLSEGTYMLRVSAGSRRFVLPFVVKQ